MDNSSWQFLRQGPKIIVKNVQQGKVSKILLDMDTKTEANDLLSRLQQYSLKARQEQEKQTEIGQWIAESSKQPLDDSSMDESVTASIDESNTVEPPIPSLLPFLPDFAPLPTSSLHPNAVSPLSPSYRTVDAHKSSAPHAHEPESFLHPPSSKRPASALLTETAQASLYSDASNPRQSALNAASNEAPSSDEYDIFDYIDRNTSIPSHEIRIIDGATMLESESTTNRELEFGSTLDRHHPSLDPYHSVVDTVWAHWNDLAEEEIDNWSFEE